MDEARYDLIGAGYAATRQEDPRIAALIDAALEMHARSSTSGRAPVPTSRATGT
jgi:hypothetical protein